ncbi:MAG TPA: hypothetical protein VER03_25525 [Bryobacteraceae bacterium]|nr:hypothetical protein [Bryobacteraceae bacterium]
MGINSALPWRDALHEGPVPSAASPDELCEVRAQFLASSGWGEHHVVATDLHQRNAALLAADEVTLWFEHDLYDQLQLIQILSMIPGKPAWLAQSDTFIGPMQAAEIRVLASAVKPVTPQQFEVAAAGWAAFRSSNPAAVPDFLRSDTSCLPYLRSAFNRLLEERPGSADGLSRTERQILRVAATGPASFAELFRQTQAMEEAAFAGDSLIELSVWRLSECRTPLLTTNPWRLTEAGRQVLEGSANHLGINRVDRWLGGLHVVYGH